jgi:hypothetical protein
MMTCGRQFEDLALLEGIKVEFTFFPFSGIESGSENWGGNAQTSFTMSNTVDIVSDARSMSCVSSSRESIDIFTDFKCLAVLSNVTEEKFHVSK